MVIIQQHTYFVSRISRLVFWNGSGLEGPVAKPPPTKQKSRLNCERPWKGLGALTGLRPWEALGGSERLGV